MKHFRLKIRPQFLELIENGTKKHEYRLNTQERKSIKIGDQITLISNQDDSKYINALVTSKQEYKSWEEALNEHWEDDFKGKYDTLDDALKVCYKFYSHDEVEKYGIVKLGIIPIKRKLRKSRILLDSNIVIYRESHNNVSFEVTNLFKWLDKLHCQKVLHS